MYVAIFVKLSEGNHEYVPVGGQVRINVRIPGKVTADSGAW